MVERESVSRSFGDFDFSEMVGLGYQIDFFFVTDWEEREFFRIRIRTLVIFFGMNLLKLKWCEVVVE